MEELKKLWEEDKLVKYLGKYTHRIAVSNHRIVRILHYGLLCSRTKNQKLTLCRNLLGCRKYLSKLRDMEKPEIPEHLYGIKVCVCKACGGHLGKPQMRKTLRC